MLVQRPLIRVLVVDDNREFIEAARAWIATEPRLSFIGDAEDGLAALEAERRLRPDVVLIDAVMPRCDGFEATRRIKLQDAAPIVVIISFADSETVRHAAWVSGADAFVAKGESSDRLLAALLQSRPSSRRSGELPPPSWVASSRLESTD